MHGHSFQFDEPPRAGDAATDAGQVFFSQACPICGRMLRVMVNLLGRRVYCQHCGGGFVAADESLRSHLVSGGAGGRSCEQTVDDLLARAEAALARMDDRRRVSR